jgi:hypothetical protein
VNRYIDEVEFFGHPMVRSAHRNTIEVTRDADLTLRGDCIIGVRADKGLSDLSGEVRETIMLEGSELEIAIWVGSETFLVKAKGSPRLSLQDPHEIVLRRSDFVSPRTLAIRADAAAKDLPRSMVEKLRSQDCRGVMRIEVRV